MLLFGGSNGIGTIVRLHASHGSYSGYTSTPQLLLSQFYSTKSTKVESTAGTGCGGKVKPRLECCDTIRISQWLVKGIFLDPRQYYLCWSMWWNRQRIFQTFLLLSDIITHLFVACLEASRTRLDWGVSKWGCIMASVPCDVTERDAVVLVIGSEFVVLEVATDLTAPTSIETVYFIGIERETALGAPLSPSAPTPLPKSAPLHPPIIPS